MKYFNIITLLVGLIVNIALYVASPTNIGIGISGNGEVSAVGNINEVGDKDGYWFYLDSCDSKKITTIVGYYSGNKADSLWVQFYGDTYPAVYASYYMTNDSARGFYYTYDENGHLKRMFYVYPNQVKLEWKYYDDIKTDSMLWAPCYHSLGEYEKECFSELEIQPFSTIYADVIIFDIALLTLLLAVNLMSMILDKCYKQPKQ
ncbi:MAG: hypothetical protein IKR17_02025 [Bacteroidales bacterium]|nr:hypothetical protein [Bacteroidales bacterium]